MSKTTTESKGSVSTGSSTTPLTLSSPTTSAKSTLSTHDKNMKKYYKSLENMEKLKLRIAKYKVERDTLDAKIVDLQKYLNIPHEDAPTELK